MDSFDPYQEWLGIPSQMRPLNHYILIGIRIFESDPREIRKAYDARVKLLKTFQSGPRGEISAQLISKIGKAKRDLSDPERKSKYDISLKKILKDRQRELERSQEELEGESEQAHQSPAGSEPSESFIVVDAQRSETQIPQTQRSDAVTAIPTTSSVQPQRLAKSKFDISSDEDQEDGESEVLSPFSLLTDIRYLVGLLALSVVIMTATVKLFGSGGVEVAETPADSQPQNSAPVEKVESPPKPLDLLARVKQADDGSFELPIAKGSLTGTDINLGSNGITGWSLGDEAVWMLVVNDRRDGYFNCRITYQANQESAFEIQLGNRKPRPFTIYPHDKDFEEQFIVRLGAAKKDSNEQLLRIKSTQTRAHEVQIKRIRLIPNR